MRKAFINIKKISIKRIHAKKKACKKYLKEKALIVFNNKKEKNNEYTHYNK